MVEQNQEQPFQEGEVFAILKPLTEEEKQRIEEEQKKIDTLHEMDADPNLLSGGTISNPHPVNKEVEQKFFAKKD